MSGFMRGEENRLVADVLIIGGGMAGAWAATAAAKEGARVVLVEKGYCGTSGVTAAAGPGHWWAPPDPPEARANAIAARQKIAFGLGEPDWMLRTIDETYRLLPTIASYYDFPKDEQGRVRNYRAMRGPEYMRALRRQIVDLGVTILDHAPALELLAHSDGAVGGAAGIRTQHGGAPWRIAAGAVILAAGGTSFRSHLLGSATNTGDGYLMAAEAGAELSGMEFTAAYTVAPKHSTMTRTMSYAFADYFDADGNPIDAPFGPDQTERLAEAMLAGPVFCSLGRLPEDIRRHLPTISPNVMLPFARWGIDPFRDRFEVMLHTDGTIRGVGGVRVRDADCGTGVPGLYVAGDTASRELVAGASSGGGNVNSAWALSSGTWAGRAAARRARNLPATFGGLMPLGLAGLRPARSPRRVEASEAIAAVRAEMHPYDKNLFRTGNRLAASRRALDAVWSDLAAHGSDTGRAALAMREAASLVASARWSIATALARTETRGMHRRLDHPALDRSLTTRLIASGIDAIAVRPEAPTGVEVSEDAA